MEQIELSAFIKSILSEVATGVSEANLAVKQADNIADNFFVLRGDPHGTKLPGIAFDIAITASKSQKDKAGFMVALANLGGGANTEKGAGSEVVHRIKFEVGLYYNYSGEARHPQK